LSELAAAAGRAIGEAAIIATLSVMTVFYSIFGNLL